MLNRKQTKQTKKAQNKIKTAVFMNYLLHVLFLVKTYLFLTKVRGNQISNWSNYYVLRLWQFSNKISIIITRPLVLNWLIQTHVFRPNNIIMVFYYCCYCYLKKIPQNSSYSSPELRRLVKKKNIQKNNNKKPRQLWLFWAIESSHVTAIKIYRV